MTAVRPVCARGLREARAPTRPTFLSIVSDGEAAVATQKVIGRCPSRPATPTIPSSVRNRRAGHFSAAATTASTVLTRRGAAGQRRTSGRGRGQGGTAFMAAAATISRDAIRAGRGQVIGGPSQVKGMCTARTSGQTAATYEIGLPISKTSGAAKGGGLRGVSGGSSSNGHSVPVKANANCSHTLRVSLSLRDKRVPKRIVNWDRIIGASARPMRRLRVAKRLLRSWPFYHKLKRVAKPPFPKFSVRRRPPLDLFGAEGKKLALRRLAKIAVA